MFRLTRIEEDSTEDYGLWSTVEKAVEAGLIRMDKRKEKLPAKGWVVREQGEKPRVYTFDPSLTKEIYPLAIEPLQ